MRLTWRKLPANAFDAQVSLYHWVAAALVFGKAGLKQGATGRGRKFKGDRALQKRISVQTRGFWGSDAATVEIHRRNGATLSATIEHATGSIAWPMSDAQLDAKFLALAVRVLDGDRAAALLAACRQIDRCDECCRHRPSWGA